MKNTEFPYFLNAKGTVVPIWQAVPHYDLKGKPEVENIIKALPYNHRLTMVEYFWHRF